MENIADEFARWLLSRFAPATAQKECQNAAQFFRHAHRSQLIDRNPFDGVSVGMATNDDRRVFVTRDVISKVLDKCPNWQWRLVVALARYGGLRCPSEIALLKLSDIHWDSDRFTVTSPKTQRYGKATRVVPIFPELKKYFDEAFTMAAEVEKWAVPMLGGDMTRNLGTTLHKIVRRAGVTPWPKLFQNCRSSRQTELEQVYPTYVVCSWLGNTPSVAHKHYLTVTDDHFASASKIEASSSEDPKTGDWLGTRTPVSTRGEAQKKSRILLPVRENASFFDVVGLLENAQIAARGVEPPHP